MTGFVAAPVVSPALPVADMIAASGFWPALSILAFRDAQRIGTLVTDGRCRAALIGGVISAAVALSAWQVTQEAAGAETLLDVPAPSGQPETLGGEQRASVLWRRAVHAFAAADLADTHNDVSATEPGRDRREQRAAGSDELRATATAAIRDLLGRTRTKVALV